MVQAAALWVVLVVAVFVAAKPTVYSAVYNPSSTYTWTLQPGKVPDAASWAWVEDTIMQNGWSTLEIKTNPVFADHIQAHAAGFIEGAVTNKLIVENRKNTAGPVLPEVMKFLHENDQWMRSKVKAHAPHIDIDMHGYKTLPVTITDDEMRQFKGAVLAVDSYWEQVGLMLNQLDGLFAGYSQYPVLNQTLTYDDFLVGVSGGDLYDITVAIKNNVTDFRNMIKRSKSQSNDDGVNYNAHCSSLVKWTSDKQNLLSSHVTWTSFSQLLRTYKHYEFNFNSKSTAARKISFSGYPGFLVSGDDWYVTDRKLVIMETTNSVFNMSLYRAVTPHTVMYWIRNTIANRCANTGPQWVTLFSLYNSGTYNNQWMVVDYKLFKRGQDLKPATLFIAEQIPGYVVTKDVTSVVAETSYWASYNIPYLPFVYNISGYPAKEQQYGDAYSYTKCPRANIFRRDQHTVKDLASMKAIMRYNNYLHDPYSLGDACNGISARCDLNKVKPSLFGGIDCKISDATLMESLTSVANSGPTWEMLPPFSWANWPGAQPVGQPKTFQFDFVTMSPRSDE